MAVLSAGTGVGLTRSGTFLTLGADWTITGWIEPVTSTPTGSLSRTFFVHGDPAYVNPYIWIGSDPDTNNIWLQLWDGSSATDSAKRSGPLDVWQPFALVYDDSGTSLQWWLNNVLVDTLTVDLGTYVFVEKLEDLFIEASLGSWSDMAAAYVRVWDVVLSASELAAEWASATTVSSTSPIADTPLTDASTLTDTTGNGHGWTAVGAVGSTTGPTLETEFTQVIFSRTYGDEIGNSAGDPAWAPLRAATKFYSAAIFPTAKEAMAAPWRVAGTFSNLYVEIYVPVLRRTYNPIHWPDIDFTLLVDGVATALTVTLPAGSAGSAGVASSNTSDSVTIAPGQTVEWERSDKPIPNLNGVAAHFKFSVSFTPAANDESGYVAGCNLNVNSAGTGQVVGPFNADEKFHDGNWNTGHTTGNNGEPTQWSIMPCPGTITSLQVNLTAAPGAGNSRTFVLQESGTSDTTTQIVISDSAVTGTATFAMHVDTLDYVTLRHDNASGPVAAKASYGISFTPDEPGQYIYSVTQSSSNASRTLEDWFGGQGGGSYQNTPYAPTPPGAPPEDDPTDFMGLPGGIDPFSVEAFIVAIYGSPGTSKSYVMTPWVNGEAPTDGPTLTLSDATCVAQTNTGTLTLTGPTDLLTMDVVPSGTPSAVHFFWTFLMVGPSSPVPPDIPDTRVIRRERKFPLPSSENNYRMTMHKLEFILQAGIGLPEGDEADPAVQGSDPQVMLRISYDGGNTWGTERWASAGKIGQYDRRVVFWQCGQYRNAVADLVVTDPVPWTFIKCIGEWTEGTS